MDEIDNFVRKIELFVKGEPFYSRLKKTSNVTSFDAGKNESISLLEKEIINCKKCELHKFRINAVPGEGNCTSKLMIIGEGPGREEDLQGRPFVGKAGQLLTKLLEEIGIKREDVYITNVVKCRPPENRVPTPKEIEQCKPYLKKQIEIIKPRVILLLGSTASKVVIGEEKITKVRGKFFEIEDIIFFPTFHPAAVLRDESVKLPIIKEDFRKLKEILTTTF